MSTGTLYIVATPIGNLTDMSKRVISTLQEVDLIAAEDTRHSRKLCQHFGIQTPMMSMHQHNEAERAAQLLKRLQVGENIALISDAGTPLISDPGHKLVHLIHQAGIKVVPIPGPCALTTALSASGLPSDAFVFLGFLPAKTQQRQARLQAMVHQPLTIVCYEAPHRIVDLLNDCVAIFGAARYAVVARELTKLYETIHADTLSELCEWIQHPDQQRGEFVVMIAGADEPEPGQGVDVLAVLRVLLEELPPRKAAKLAARITGEKANDLYTLALTLTER